MNYNITSTVKFGVFKIHWDGLLLLSVDQPFILNSFLWKEKGVYGIEITSHGNKTTLEFDTREKWEAVLKVLDKVM